MSTSDGAQQAAGFSAAELAKLSGVSRATLARWIRQGLLRGAPGRDGTLTFGFREVAQLRRITSLLGGARGAKADALLAAAARGEALRQQDGRVVAWDDAGAWEPHSRQGVLPLEGAMPPTDAKVVRLGERGCGPGDRESSSESLFDQALEAEAGNPELAMSLYQEVIERDEGRRAEASVNLGRLHQVAGDPTRAAELYAQALRFDPCCASAWFNLGVLRQARGDARGALLAYDEAVAIDPTMVDAHFNAASVCEALGDRKRALRHWHRYRQLTDT